MEFMIKYHSIKYLKALTKSAQKNDGFRDMAFGVSSYKFNFVFVASEPRGRKLLKVSRTFP